MGAFGSYDVPVAQLTAVAERCAAVLARYQALHATHADDFFVAQPWDRIADAAESRAVRAAAEALTDAECASLPELPQVWFAHETSKGNRANDTPPSTHLPSR